MKHPPRAVTPAEFAVLVALADGDKHGYAILKAMAREGGAVTLGPATLYTIIRRFVASGFIAETTQRPHPDLDDERRRYYRLTPAGRAVARAEAERMETALEAARGRRLLGRPRRA
jgi:DNA-binding PadR family transcriptional regulator